MLVYSLPLCNYGGKNIDAMLVSALLVVWGAASRQAAEDFARFCFTPEAQAEFGKVGFRPNPKLCKDQPAHLVSERVSEERSEGVGEKGSERVNGGVGERVGLLIEWKAGTTAINQSPFSGPKPANAKAPTSLFC
jgi:hypothetical protein